MADEYYEISPSAHRVVWLNGQHMKPILGFDALRSSLDWSYNHHKLQVVWLDGCSVKLEVPKVKRVRGYTCHPHSLTSPNAFMTSIKMGTYLNFYLDEYDSIEKCSLVLEGLEAIHRDKNSKVKDKILVTRMDAACTDNLHYSSNGLFLSVTDETAGIEKSHSTSQTLENYSTISSHTSQPTTNISLKNNEQDKTQIISKSVSNRVFRTSWVCSKKKKRSKQSTINNSLNLSNSSNKILQTESSNEQNNLEEKTPLQDVKTNQSVFYVNYEESTESKKENKQEKVQTDPSIKYITNNENFKLHSKEQVNNEKNKLKQGSKINGTDYENTTSIDNDQCKSQHIEKFAKTKILIENETREIKHLREKLQEHVWTTEMDLSASEEVTDILSASSDDDEDWQDVADEDIYKVISKSVCADITHLLHQKWLTGTLSCVNDKKDSKSELITNECSSQNNSDRVQQHNEEIDDRYLLRRSSDNERASKLIYEIAEQQWHLKKSQENLLVDSSTKFPASSDIRNTNKENEISLAPAQGHVQTESNSPSEKSAMNTGVKKAGCLMENNACTAIDVEEINSKVQRIGPKKMLLVLLLRPAAAQQAWQFTSAYIKVLYRESQQTLNACTHKGSKMQRRPIKRMRQISRRKIRPEAVCARVAPTT